MTEECGAFVCCELGEERCDALPKVGHGSLCGFAQKGFELGEGKFDGVEIGRVGRQIDQRGPGRFNEVAHARDLVSREVVDDDDIALAEDGNQHLGEVDKKGLTVHRPIEKEGSDQAGTAQARGKSGCLPMAPGDRRNQALAPGASATQAHHLGVGAGLVDEDQFVGIESGLVGLPASSLLSDIGPVLFARVQAFF